MEEQAKASGHPRRPSEIGRRNPGAADLCRAFMESDGWRDLFDLAKGQETTAWVRTPFGSKKVRVTPTVDERLTALKFVASYGYGRPRESLDLTSNGRSVTNFLLSAFGQAAGPGVPEEGPE